MHKTILPLFFLFFSLAAHAQTSGADAMRPTPITQNTVTLPYRISDEGTKLPDITWGLDAAWLSEGNVRRGVNFAGQDMIGIMRLCFQTTAPVGDDLQLTDSQKKTLDERISLAKRWAPKAVINLNSDQEAGVDEWYHVYGSDKKVSTYAPRWAALIAATKAYVETKGLKVISVSPFNEPDYGEGKTWGWQQGSKAEMLEICRLLREDEAYAEAFRDVLLCGGNTLDDDYALPWYNYCKKYLDEGNTHQLAGTFDNFAKFYQTVVADGKVAVGDELHNTMECMVGSEYGLTKGIWWGTCDHTRSQFMKASRGLRLGYAEHRNNWTAASIYRHPGGQVQAFGGTSERQAVTTSYRLTATDHDVFYNGVGPTREYLMTLPGGTDYQVGQTNAETCLDIQDGDDIMPALPTQPTTYKLVNRFSGHVMALSGNSIVNATSMAQEKNVAAGTANLAQQWIIRPIGDRSGGDFSYYKIMNARDTTLLIDVQNWSLEDRGSLIGYQGGLGDNEQWYFEYAGEGWFYIRSRHSALCIEVTPGTESQQKLTRRPLCQGTFTGEAIQQWRLLPAGVVYDAVAPAVPTALSAQSQAASVRLTWQAPSDKDINHYIVLRSTDQQTWNTIHNLVPGTEYVDNTAEAGTTYYYRVQTVDHSLNRSEPSDVAHAASTGERALVCHITADTDLQDATGNGNHAALYGTQRLTPGRLDSALVLDGKSQFVQLPAAIANTVELTIAAWFYWRGGNTWQRLFDFGTDTDHYVFLTTSAGSGPRLAIKNGGTEQTMSISQTLGTNRWRHVAITFSGEAITVYFDGKAVATNKNISLRPKDIRPVYNYVGRSQFVADPTLNADVDDIRVYNYALTGDEIGQLLTEADAVLLPFAPQKTAQEAYTLDGKLIPTRMMRHGQTYIIDGKKILF